MTGPDRVPEDPSRTMPARGPALQVGDGPVMILADGDVLWLAQDGTGAGLTVAEWLANVVPPGHGELARVSGRFPEPNLVHCPNPKHWARPLDQQLILHDGDRLSAWCPECRGYWSARTDPAGVSVFTVVSVFEEVSADDPVTWTRTPLGAHQVRSLSAEERAALVHALVQETHAEHRRRRDPGRDCDCGGEVEGLPVCAGGCR